MSKDDKQLNLFDRPEAIKQKTSNLSSGARKLLHEELYRLFDRRAHDAYAEHESHYEADVEYAWKDNVNLAHRILSLKNVTREDIVASIIFFLAEIENYKRFYHKQKKGIRTAKKYMLLERECGNPLLIITYLLRKTIHDHVSDEEADIVAELLIRNAGYREGEIERFYLWLLGCIGTKRQVPHLLVYRSRVRDDAFGYPKYIVDSSSARPVSDEEYKRIRNDRLKRVSEIKKTISKR